MSSYQLAGDAPPSYFLVTGIIFAAVGFYLLYAARAAAKEAAADAQQHLSPAQQRIREKFRGDPRQIRLGAIVLLLMGASFIGLYLVTSRA